MTNIFGSTAVVTGGQRGLGQQLAAQLLARGATTVYVTARTPVPTGNPRLIPIACDVTNPADVTAVAEVAPDANIVINNAGLWSTKTFLEDDTDLADLDALLATNLFGPLRIIQSFAGILKANGGGAIVNINSLSAWVAGRDGYNVSKAALWSATNSIRVHLREQGTQLLGVHVGPIDTDMVAALDVVKSSPEYVAEATLDALERGDSEVLVDVVTRGQKAALSGPVEGLELPLEALQA